MCTSPTTQASGPLRSARRFGRAIARFMRERQASTAIEFTALAIPFALLVFAILESCISFAAQEVLTNATDDIARQLRTGQLRKANVTEASHDSWSATELAPYVRHALECFTPQRCMFGSDWPVCLLAASYERVVETAQSLGAELNAADRDRVFSRNATEFYQIEELAQTA